MKKKHLSKTLCFFVSFLLSVNLGVALWSLKSESAYPAKDISKRAEPVAYITRDSKTFYFTTIEAALKDGEDKPSSDTIYVIPKTVTMIKKDCTVSSEDTLCLPFEGTTYNGRQSGSFEKAKGTAGEWRDDIGTADFADGNQDSVNKYLQSNITINPNVTLKVNGSLQIGGVLGTENSGSTPNQLQGQTSGNYCQITMDSSSKIDNYGSIDCMGYIKEKSKNNKSQIINNGNAKMYMPYVVYDFKGGSCTAGMAANDSYKEFPISQYDFPNCQSEITFKFGSELKGYVDLYTDEKKELNNSIILHARHNTDEMGIVGTKDSLFELQNEDSSLKIKYTPIGDAKFTSYSQNGENRTGSAGITNMEITGDMKFNATSLSINAAEDLETKGAMILLKWLVDLIMNKLSQTIETSVIDYPIPWNFCIKVNSGNFTISNKMKFLGGSKLITNRNSTLSLSKNAAVIFYDSSSGSSLYEDEPSPNKTIYPIDKGDATMVNNGAINIKSGSFFGGKIQSSEIGSSIAVESGASLKYSTKEGKGTVSIGTTGVKMSFVDYKNSPINKNACVDLLFSDGSSISETQLVAGATYKSIESNGKIVWTKV